MTVIHHIEKLVLLVLRSEKIDSSDIFSFDFTSVFIVCVFDVFSVSVSIVVNLYV